MTTQDRSAPAVVKQCASCPWRVDCVPARDIPRYSRELHEGLGETCIAEPASLVSTGYVMACHYSKPGEEFPCAGWLYHQLGDGNNITLRMMVIRGKMPVPDVDGEQHASFEETLPL